VGANSVVVKDVPPNSVVFGVPARPVKLLRPDPAAGG
jgi:acetyltransferase-like isoleucine patch superfamily enzyme